jgi:integrase
MARRATVNLNLPSGLRKKLLPSGNTFYYYDVGGKPRKWLPLGSNYIEALRQFAQLEQSKASRQLVERITFVQIADRYTIEVMPTKAPRSQKDNAVQLKKLLQFFNDPPVAMALIEPIHIRQYLTWRKDAPRRANLEVALFSHIFNYAREWGYTSNANPCEGVRKFKMTGRDNYVSDELYEAVHAAACQPVRDALDLAYLTGQRPADVLKMTDSDVTDGHLAVQQNKTGARLRIAVKGALEVLLCSVAIRKAGHKVCTGALIVNEKGRALTMDAFRWRFDKARAAAGVSKDAFQFRDLRAKAGTDKEDSQGMAAAKDQLGHANESMTRHYVRNALGKKVSATK